MTFDWLGLVIIVVIAGAYVGLWFVGKKVSFMWHMLSALGAGLILGMVIQLIWPIVTRGSNTLPRPSVDFAFDWLNIIRTAYGNLLQLMVMPLVVVAIITGILKASDSSAEGKKIGKGAAVAIATLMITCGISALLAIFTTLILDGVGMSMSARNLMGGESKTTAGQEGDASLSSTIGGVFAATNVLGALSNNSILPIMFLSLVFAFIIVNLKKDEDTADAGNKLQTAINVIYEFVMGLVDFVIGLAPYGVFAYILNFGANTSFANYATLGVFVIASYIAMIAMWAVHMLIMFLCGVTPVRFFKKAGKSLIMAFTTRSSMATLPTTIKCMEDIGVEDTLATFSGTFSTCVGQNGCGGTYPAMLATMVYIGYFGGISVGQIIILVFIVMICSLGIAGVGGGATAAGLMVFGTLGWAEFVPIVGILFSVEALIDMGRTTLNVSGGHVAGIVAGRFTGALNLRAAKAETLDA